MNAGRTGLAVIALTGAAALGQGTMTFSWTTEDTGNGDGVLQPGESAVLTLWAFMDPEQVGLAGTNYDIAGDARWGSTGSIDHAMNFIDSLGTGPGTLHADNSITGIKAFQLPPFFNMLFYADNPVALYEIVWTPTDYSPGSIGFWCENHQNASVYTDNFGSSVEYAIVNEPGSMRVVPAPGSFVALGVAFGAGAAFGRRKGR
ncbi:MAG: hypothetical protein IT431_01695 [Phycisphaerales bacterium]|nr:hypothetical protein [Phycisphaerales bacterium]